MARSDQVQPEGLDERGLADPGHAGDAEAHRPAALGQHTLQKRVGLGPVVGAGRFDERDGLRQHPPVAGQHALGQPRGLPGAHQLSLSA